MTKRVKSIALMLIAALFISAGYIEMNENMSGLDDSAFQAFAALNTENCQNAPAVVARTGANLVTTMTFAASNPGNTATYQQATGALTMGTTYGVGGTLAGIITAINNTFPGTLPTGFTALIPAQTVTVPIVGNAGKITGVPTQSFSSANFAGTTPSQLSCYKQHNTTNAWTALTYVTADPTITEPADGTFAIYRDNGAAAAGTFISSSTAMLGAGTNYYLVAYIQDGGSFDADGAANAAVVDPAVLGIGTGGGGGVLSSSSSGCVFNPMATLSIEWLLLLIAPAIMVIRRRK